MNEGLAQHILKLGHELEEIRVRALTGIKNKLDRGLLNERTLIDNHPDVIKQLIEWFRFQSIPKKDVALKLILRLSQDERGASLIERADPGLSILSEAVKKSGSSELEQILTEISVLIIATHPPVPEIDLHQSNRCTALSSHSQTGYGDSSKCSVDEGTCGFALWWWLPWTSLAECDNQVINAVYNSLNQNPLQAAHFLSTVMLHDFPPQIFLQQPSLIQTLLKLVGTGGGDIQRAVICCLKDLTRSLHRQMFINTDPQFVTFSVKSYLRLSLTDAESSDSSGSQLVQYGFDSQSLDNSSSRVKNLPLSIPEYCCMIMETLVGIRSGQDLLSRVLDLFACCIPQMNLLWTTDHSWAQPIRHHLHTVMTSLASHLNKSFSSDGVSRLEIEIATWLVLKCVAPLDICSTIVPKDLQHIIIDCLLDPVLYILYPYIYNNFLSYSKAFKYVEKQSTYAGIKELAFSIECSAKFIRDHDTMEKSYAIATFSKSLTTFHYHQQFAIIEQFIELVTNKWALSESETETCSEILLQLLCDDRDGGRVMMTAYQACNQRIHSLLGPDNAINPTLDPLSKLSIILNYKVLYEIISRGLVSKIEKVRKWSEDILLIVLKCDAVLPKRCWSEIMRQVSEVLPLLGAFANKSTSLGRAIIRLVDPDVAPTIPLSAIQVLTGNIRILTCKDSLCRDEAISRIVFLLNLNPDPEASYHYTNLCFPDNPICGKQNLTGLYEAGSLVRVLELLVSPGVDGKVIKSAIIQLSLMTDDSKLHDSFFEHGGVQLVKNQLQKVIRNETEECRYLYGPLITVLRNIAKYNTRIRQEFSRDYDMLSSILKGLLMFDCDWRVQRDAAQLLVLLIYCDLIILSDGAVSLPDIIVDRIRLPFPRVSHSLTAQISLPSAKDDLLNDKRLLTLLGLQWCVSYAIGGLAEVLGPGLSLPSPIPGVLTVPVITLRDLRSSYIPHNIRCFLCSLSIANSHTSAIEAIIALSRYVELCGISSASIKEEVSKLPWEESLRRFLYTPPASVQDQQLLLIILRFLSMATNYLPYLIIWITKLLKDPSQVLSRPLTQLTADDSTNLKKELCMEILFLVDKCFKDKNVEKSGLEYLINSLVECLSNSHTQHFYSLGVLDLLLRCISSATRYLENDSLVCSLVDCSLLWSLLPAFHCASPESCMGVTITRLTVTCLNHLLQRSSAGSSGHRKNWDKHWLVKEVKWLGDVLKNECDSGLRAGTLQLMSGICANTHSTSFLLSAVPQAFPTALRILLDEDEPSLVRTQAANLCTNILCHSLDKSHLTVCSDNGLYRNVAVQVSKLNFCSSLSGSQIRTLQVNTSKPNNVCQESEEKGGMVTVDLVSASCRLVMNLLALDIQLVQPDINNQGLTLALFSCISEWRRKSGGKLSDQGVVHMFICACSLLTHCMPDGNWTNAQSNLIVPPPPPPIISESVSTVFWLLHVSTYADSVEERDRLELWKSALRLLGSLIGSKTAEDLPISGPIPSPVVDVMCLCIKTTVPAGLQAATLLAIPALTPALSSDNSEVLVAALMSEWDKLSGGKSLRWALASILSSSHAGTNTALRLGLVQYILTRFQETHVMLTVLPPDTPRSKKCNAVLSSLSVDVALLTNMLASCDEAKSLCVGGGLADTLHKLWAWCLLDFSLLTSLLQVLVTFTAYSPQAAQSLVLTSTMAGVGQRKSPTSNSLLHAALALLGKEVYPALVRRRVLELTMHACQAQESRLVLSKSNIIVEFLKLFKSKKPTSTEDIEGAWFDFMTVFTSYPEGQALFTKTDAALDQLVECIESNRSRAGALSIIRNLSVCQPNKQKLIASNKMLTLLSDKLLEGGVSEEEVRDIALLVWSMSANSQKGKTAVKSVALDSRFQYTLASSNFGHNTTRLIQKVVSIIKQ